MTIILSASALDKVTDIINSLCDYDNLQDYKITLYTKEQSFIHVEVVKCKDGTCTTLVSADVKDEDI